MGSKLRISGIIPESIVDGEGLRLVVFTQGCPHHCKGCHNPETHPLAGGKELEAEEIIAMARENPLLSGITFSGGEPFLQPAPLYEIAKELRSKEFDIVAYTGYTYEALLAMAATNEDIQRLLDMTDILIDGPYIEEERDLSLPFRGSRNQRILRLREG